MTNRAVRVLSGGSRDLYWRTLIGRQGLRRPRHVVPTTNKTAFFKMKAIGTRGFKPLGK